jgi:NitT/TauT family transport system substrate-binding protein
VFGGKMKRILNLFLVIFCGITTLSLVSCQEKVKILESVTVQLQWTHQAEFAGFYVADQKGYYADEGLAVTFIEGGTEVDSLANVLDGTAQFGTANADQLIVARSEGKPLRALAVEYRRSPTVFISLVDSGITRPEDFVGKTIRVPMTIIPTLHAMTSRVGVTPDQYTEVNLPSDMALFTSGEVPIWGAYITSLVITIQQAGYSINIIYPDDYGVHFYADTIFASEDFINSNPELVLRFLRATLKGWVFASENPTEIGSMVVKYNSAADPALEETRMIASLSLVNTGEDHIGWMKPEIWSGMEQTLREQNVLTNPFDVTQVYTMQFLEEIYK